jgi:hypothetical protein
VVAALLAVSVLNVQQNPQDISAFYLAHIYQQLSTQPNGSQSPIPSNLSNPAKPFTPPTSAVWVNGLWFFSLVVSLTCALLATLVQQWARRYLRVAYPRYSPQKQARIRAFYKKNLHISWTIILLPALLHISLFLFFSGLSVFLFGVHLTIFKVVTTWIGLCVILYAWLTFLPIVYKGNLHSTPLSASLFFCITGTRYLFFRVLNLFKFKLPQYFPSLDSSIRIPLRSREPPAVHIDDFSYSMRKRADEFAFKLDPNIEHQLLSWTFESLYEDTELEKFYDALSRLCDSETGKDLKLQRGFIKPHERKLSSALIGLMNRTLSSNLVSESLKQHRMIICAKVVESTSLLGHWWFLRSVLFRGWYRFLYCVEFGLLVQSWKNIAYNVTTFYAQCVTALTVSIVQRDERWLQLASDLPGAPKPLLHKYIEHGDSILLANVIFIIRRTVQTYSGSAFRHREDILGASSRTLETVCQLDCTRILPELQDEFCELWNQLVDAARTVQHPHHHVVVIMTTLKNIRKLFKTLHSAQMESYTTNYGDPVHRSLHMTDDQDPILDDPMSYPICTIGDHRRALSVPGLLFDEPDPDEASPPGPALDLSRVPTPSIPYAVAWPSTVIRPLHAPSPQAPYSALAASSQYSHFVGPHSHPVAPFDPITSFPEPQLIHSHASIVPHGNVPSFPPPVIFPSIHVTSSSVSLGGQSTRSEQIHSGDPTIN